MRVVVAVSVTVSVRPPFVAESVADMANVSVAVVVSEGVHDSVLVTSSVAVVVRSSSFVIVLRSEGVHVGGGVTVSVRVHVGSNVPRDTVNEAESEAFVTSSDEFVFVVVPSGVHVGEAEMVIVLLFPGADSVMLLACVALTEEEFASVRDGEKEYVASTERLGVGARVRLRVRLALRSSDGVGDVLADFSCPDSDGDHEGVTLINHDMDGVATCVSDTKQVRD